MRHNLEGLCTAEMKGVYRAAREFYKKFSRMKFGWDYEDLLQEGALSVIAGRRTWKGDANSIALVVWSQVCAYRAMVKMVFRHESACDDGKIHRMDIRFVPCGHNGKPLDMDKFECVEQAVPSSEKAKAYASEMLGHVTAKQKDAILRLFQISGGVRPAAAHNRKDPDSVEYYRCKSSVICAVRKLRKIYAPDLVGKPISIKAS